MTHEEQERKPIGRPRLPPGEGKLHAIGIRTTREIKDLLQDAANSSGRSVAQEVERRVERSFQATELLNEALQMRYGPQGARFLGLVGQMMLAAVVNAHIAEADWLSDPTAVAAVKRAMIRFIAEFPDPPGQPTAGAIEAATARADRLLSVLGTISDVGEGPWAATVRKDFGEPTASRLIARRNAARSAEQDELPKADPANLAARKTAEGEAKPDDEPSEG